ncbi:MAG: class I SAM-dependent methyltransferase [bacterium]
MANEIERKRWNDERQVANWYKRERFTDRVTPHVVAALSPKAGERVLDIGAGGGKLSLAIAGLVGAKGHVTGADISAGMVEWATGRAKEVGTTNVSFLQADVQSEPVPGGPFDAATSQFGVMFFDEPTVAFTNIRKQLKPGGRIAFACWQPAARNTWNAGPVLAPFVPRPPAPPEGKSATGPFALGEPRATRALLTGAGFVDIQRVPKQLVVVTPGESIADEQQVVSMGVPTEQQDAARAAMAKHYARFLRSDGLSRFELNIQIFSARRG